MFSRSTLGSQLFLRSRRILAGEPKPKHVYIAAAAGSAVNSQIHSIHTGPWLAGPKHSKDDAESSSVLEEIAQQTDKRHKEFYDQFSNYLDSLKTAEIKPRQPDEFEKAADEKMASALTELFSKIKVEVTPELLERRKMLREKYPAIFGKISDSDLDGPDQQ
ncbi:hypothetical protein IWW45_008754 [Coemansia sp. RSA 485]|nr:hypothetical protein IWW45_008754 [Coemansia sp. RSA 485]KAJ2596452.1 hypothetical protein GGF39_003442 [Coemansia sp. RSA 1721]